MELGSHTIAHSKVFDQFPMGTGREACPSYAPYVKNRMKVQNASVLGELRVSKFLIDHFSGQEIVSFRPGELSNPYGLPQALRATGFRHSSTATANNSLTHLPYQLTYDRLTESEVDIFEFPVTIEDEELPKMGDRLPQALEVARKIGRYGGSVVVLIHRTFSITSSSSRKGLWRVYGPMPGSDRCVNSVAGGLRAIRSRSM